MADKKISQLSSATTPLAGTEVLPIVQGGATVKVSAADVTSGRAVSALTYTSTATTGTAPFTVSSTTQVANLNAATAGTASNLLSNATTGVLQVTGPGAATTRVMTVPNANFTAARTDAAQTFTGNQTYNNNVFIPSGVVHIGETTAGTYLDVYNGTTDAQRVRITTSGTDGIIRATRSGGTTPNLLFQIDSTEYFKIGNTGNVTVNNGNLVVGTADKGIDFSASSHAAGMTSELLNDYEEGTWTATVKGGTTDPTTPLTGTGYYTKIGRQVTAIFELNAGNATGATGQIQIAGLPYANWAASRSSGTLWHDRASSTSVEAMLNTSSSTVVAVDGKGAPVTWATSGTTYMNLCITYFV